MLKNVNCIGFYTQPVSDSFFPDLDADPAWTVAAAEEPAQEDGELTT